MRRSALFFSSLLVLAAFAPAGAQARVWSLEECLDRAIDQSTTVGNFTEDLNTARQDVLAKYGNFLPNANLSFYGGRNFVGPTPSVAVDSQGRLIDQAGFDHSQYSFSIGGNMMLFDWGANIKSLTASRRTAEAAEHDLQYQKDVVTAQVIRAYYNFVRRKNLHVVQEESVRAAQRNLEQVEAFFKIGSNTRADVLQAKVRLGNTQLDLITAKNNEEIAKATLASLLNLPLEVDDLDVDSSLSIKEVHPDFRQEVDYMLEHRSDLQASRKRVSAAGQNVTAVENRRLPTLSASLNYSWNDREFPDNANFFNQDYSWNVGFFINWDLFDRFQTKSNILSARANERIAEHNLQQAKLDAVLEVRTLFLGLQQADERIRVSEEQVTQAQENLRLAEERYRVGAGTILETIDAGVSLQQAQATLVEAKCDYLIAKADLLRATGREVEAD